jgi:hypothetical protein
MSPVFQGEHSRQLRIQAIFYSDKIDGPVAKNIQLDYFYYIQTYKEIMKNRHQLLTLSIYQMSSFSLIPL